RRGECRVTSRGNIGENMKKKVAFLTLSALLLVLCVSVAAEQPKKIRRIGYLGNASSTSAIDMKVFRERLMELGHTEGQNITIEYRYFDGKVERLPELVAEIVRLNPEVVVTIGNEATRAVKNTAKEIPIVMASTSEAVRSGFVASLARPGGNITGLTGMGS